MTIAVIGRGPIGSAAARHLARAGQAVVLIGPGEPAQKATHRGVFASHWDEGRITRALDPDPFWSAVSRASIARYAEIEAESGIGFFTESGAMIAAPAGGDYMRDVAAVQAEAGINAETLTGAALAARFPCFAFPDGIEARYEPRGAGHVNPRRMVAAQTEAARRAGAEVMDATALRLDITAKGARVITDAGDVPADRVLVANGGWANTLLPEPLPLAVHARTIAFFAQDAHAQDTFAQDTFAQDTAAAPGGMPTLVYRTPAGEVPYLLPPIRYPDGQHYVKIGGDPEDSLLDTPEAVGDWFRSGGSVEVGVYLRTLIEGLMPGLDTSRMHVEPCVTVFTPEDRPAIRRLGARLAVAVAGCGRGAKCADELGRMAAEVVAG